MKRKYIWWILAIIWCVFIFLMSNKPAVESAQESSIITVFINRFLSSILGEGKLIISDNVVRKAAHFCEYFILGFLFFKAYLVDEKVQRTFWLSTVTAILYSVSDEIHQYFVPGRAMRATDVLIDSAGIVLASFILLQRVKRHSRQRRDAS